jgi:glycosyltransferase involved in cell wall biosynthesis
MRLLYLSADPGVPVLGHKGASVHLRELVRAFCAAGTEVVVASPRVAPEGDVLDARAELVEIEPVLPRSQPTLSGLRGAMRVQASQVAELACAQRAEAIYERLSLFGASGLVAARQLGIPHVLEMNAPLCEEALRFRSLPHAAEAKRIERRVCAETDHVFAVSDALAARLPHGRFSVSPNGVDPARFRAPRQRGGVFTVGFAGSLKPWHGIGVMLEAFERVRQRAPALRFEVVGSGPEAEAVEQQADRLVYRGALSHADTIEVMRGWDVGLAPFLPQPDFYFSPLKVVEYMAAEACPIASDLGQIRALLGHGERGVLVEPGNPAALAGAILRLAADRAYAAALSARARAYALDSLSWQGNAARALQVLAECSGVPAART